MRAVSGTLRRIDAQVFVAAVVAVSVFWIAYDNGSYSLPSRATLAIVLWWAVILWLVLRLLRGERVPGAALVVGGLVVALAYWTLASFLWAPSGEDAFAEFNRVSLYLGVYVLVVLAATRASVGRWADGIAAAISAVAVVALVSRLFPGSFEDRELAEFLPGVATRLAFPLGYWNGLAIFVGLGVPLLLRIALVARSAIVRGAALAPVPIVTCAIYLASSRGGVVTAVVGVLTFLVLSERRWSIAAALAVSGAASAAAIAVLLHREELVNGPLGTDLVREQGRSAALLIGLACVAAAVVYGVGCTVIGPRIQPGIRVGRAVTALAAVLVLVGIVASDPVGRFETFKASPDEVEAFDERDFVTSHILSSSGSGRWQLWTSAVDQFEESPVVGGGAGSYEHWWAEHASISHFVRDAHSLYLEALGELGLFGLALVLSLAVVGVVVGVRRMLRSTGHARVTMAALTGVWCGYVTAAGFDWVWELSAVSVLGFAVLALVTGPATDPIEPLRSTVPGESAASRRTRLGVVLGVVAWFLIFAQVIPLLAEREVARSRTAVGDGDLDDARDAADVARDIQPWASTPYLQLALVSEVRGELPEARAWIGEAIERDPRDWQHWLVSARLETKLGNVAAAERSLRRAIALNPRSPLFADLLEEEPAR